MSYCRNYCYCECEPKICCRPKKCFNSKKDFVHSISLTKNNILNGSSVPFDINVITEGTGIIHTPGSPDFNLVKPGVYKVTFTGSVKTSIVADASVGLAINGAVLPGTTVTESVVLGSIATLATQALVEVSPFITTALTVLNTSSCSQDFTNPNLIIEKIN